MTQCLLEKHVKDDPARKKPYFENIALKINVKLGGVNQIIDPKLELPSVGPTHVPTMILGADVTHPPPGIEGKSIAALVGSMDPR
jgi:eukaryotic translation initiation factor 2C